MKFIDQFRKDLIDFTNKTGIKPYKLAEAAGYHPSTVYRFLNGTRKGMQIETYVKLKDEMNKHLDKDVIWVPDPDIKKEVKDA